MSYICCCVCHRLIENLIEDCDLKDGIAELDAQKGSKKGVSLQKLVNAVNQCGVTFSVWNRKNADGSLTLKNSQAFLDVKRKIIQSLPHKLRGILCDETSEAVTELWKKLAEL